MQSLHYQRASTWHVLLQRAQHAPKQDLLQELLSLVASEAGVALLLCYLDRKTEMYNLTNSSLPTIGGRSYVHIPGLAAVAYQHAGALAVTRDAAQLAFNRLTGSVKGSL